MSRSTFEEVIAELENIADGECTCKEDDIDVCRVCKASGALNRTSADAFDSLKEISAN